MEVFGSQQPIKGSKDNDYLNRVKIRTRDEQNYEQTKKQVWANLRPNASKPLLHVKYVCRTWHTSCSFLVYILKYFGDLKFGPIWSKI